MTVNTNMNIYLVAGGGERRRGAFRRARSDGAQKEVGEHIQYLQ